MRMHAVRADQDRSRRLGNERLESFERQRAAADAVTVAAHHHRGYWPGPDAAVGVGHCRTTFMCEASRVVNGHSGALAYFKGEVPLYH